LIGIKYQSDESVTERERQLKKELSKFRITFLYSIIRMLTLY